MIDKTQYNQDSSTSTLTEKEKKRLYNKAYREANKEKMRLRDQKYREANKEKIKARNETYNEANREKLKAYREANREKLKAYREANRERIRISDKAYREANKEKINSRNKERRANHNKSLNKKTQIGRPHLPESGSNPLTLTRRAKLREYNKKRRSTDPLYKLQHNMRTLGNRVVKYLALGKKPARTEKWQGCTAEELKAYLESLFTEGMTWDNYGKYGWHIDHIRPVSSFAPEEWEQINHYTNLQPLWAEDNLKKHNNYKQEEDPGV